MRPTAKNLVSECGVSEEVAERIVRIARGKESPNTCKAVQDWVRVCYHNPSWRDRCMYAFDELLGTFGVEGTERLQWCNTGDIYAPTILDNGKSFLVGSWGDYAERNRV